MKRFLLVGCLSMSGLGAQELSLNLSGPETELSWPRSFPASSGVPAQLQSRVLSSSDLRTWVEETSITEDDFAGDGISRLTLDRPQSARFYRLEQFLSYQHRADSSAPPAVYGQQIRNARKEIGGLTLEEFANSADDADCLPSIDWDPTSATFFTEFNTSPEDHNATLAHDDPERRVTDFRLNEAELAKFMQNGFVVAPRVALDTLTDFVGSSKSPTPVDFYYSIWTDDLPVFITSDSVLDAWHQTFLSMLEEIEELVLYPALRPLVGGLANLDELTAAWESADTPGADLVRQAVTDLNLYLGTARSLLQGFDDNPATDDLASPAHWYQAAQAHSDTLKLGLYGDGYRIEDMTLFKPRGHYTNSKVLSAYFQGFLWLSRAQFQIASSNHTPLQREQSDRELRAAILLALHVRDGGFLPEWQKIESFIQSLNGQSDAMTVVEMIALLELLSLDSVDAIASETDLVTIREALLTSSYGVQEIDNGTVEPDCNPIDYELSRALSLFGQRWTPDSWTFNQVVFPNVKENGVASYRRIPSGLDAAYAVFGNDTAAPILVDRMADSEGVSFRDGYPYQENLAAARSVFDSQQTPFWTEHTYGSWLHTLRALSPTVPSSAPDTFRTSAWKRRTLNTQLMSWTQLRHDTLLYAEQSFTPPTICDFPDGYVDPYPEFWDRLSGMALQYKELLSNLELSGIFGIENRNTWGEPSQIDLRIWTTPRGYFRPPGDPLEFQILQVDRGTRIAAMSDHLENFSKQCLELQAIAERQLAGLPHTEEMKTFIRTTVENVTAHGCTGDRAYDGWYPKLYFASVLGDPEIHPSADWSPVVVDVHTDPKDVRCSGDPGAILHEGTGRAHFMLTAVKHADGTACVFGGPVMSHYEFLTDRETRLNDSEWLEQLQIGNEPEVDSWKLDFLVPE